MKVPYEYLTLAQVEKQVDTVAPLFSDTETCGFYGKVRLLQLFQEGWDKVALVSWPEHFAMAALLGKCNTKWHNAHYDITTIQQQTGTRWCPERFDDTFLLARLAFPREEKFDLDSVISYCTNYDVYARQGLDKKRLQKSKWDVLKLSPEQELYAATDVYYMPAVWATVSNAMDTPSYKLDMHVLRRCLDFQWNGMHVDKTRLFARYEKNAAIIKEAAMPINVNSWQQVRPYIGEEQSDDLAMAMFELQGNERAAQVRAVKKVMKQNSFLDKFDTEDDFIYGKFLPSTRSGRLSSKDQNLQQLPRALKEVFGYQPDEGRVLIYADYAQLELRTICAITLCRTMEELFRSGEDLHTYTARMLFGPNFEKRHRQISKTCNFSLLVI